MTSSYNNWQRQTLMQVCVGVVLVGAANYGYIAEQMGLRNKQQPVDDAAQEASLDDALKVTSGTIWGITSDNKNKPE
ncbi:hypothetical protein RI054_05g25180 [Pseudoscourfieldia marina]|eukprot:CAMPEP_0119196298 /NCGR_PEP_ID=MMETSP1316-20130426/9308_1 /TAXON_ID=41880 /ORGANISM="Pycnococcus provasolii, Strain RCC2336" /LENGTH=76 /DNA_ID=CAMNT_0007191953 /DNA_START=24 /DNA_END=254 /DNA_ORIENTATION=-